MGKNSPRQGLVLAAVAALHVFTVPAKAATDPLFALQWYLQNDGQEVGGAMGVPGADVCAVGAWVTHGGTSSVTVAIIGTGVSPHEEFGSRLLAGRAFVGDPFDTADVCGTGTHVAGLIAAARDNAVGVAGLAGPVKILPVRVYNSCSGTEKDVALGMRWAVDAGADILVVPGLHLQGTLELAAAVDYAVANDVPVFAPFGVTATNDVSYPAKFPGCIAVTATDHHDQRAAFSYFGVEADVSAPGAGIWSTNRTGGYAEVASSPAAAAALAAGAAALIKSFAPQLTAAQVRGILEQSAMDLGAPGWDAEFGWGRVNAAAALMQAPAPPVRFELLSDPPEMLLPGVPTVFDVRIANAAQFVLPAQTRLFYRMDGGAFNSVSLTFLGSGLYRVTLPAAPCDARVDFYLSASGHLGGVVREPIHAPAETFTAWAARLRTLFHDDMEADRGWVTTAPPGALAAQGVWTRGVPSGTFDGTNAQVQPGYDFSPGAKQACHYTGAPTSASTPGVGDVDLGPYTLTSPEILLTTPDALVRYARWYYWSGGTEDFLIVEASRDGGTTWATMETVAHSGAWVERSFRLGDFPALSGNRLRVRFTVSDNPNDSLVEAAVDEFHVQAIDCPSATGDADNDGLVALDDYAAMHGCIADPDVPYSNPAVCSLFDFDFDGDVDFGDAAFFAVLFNPGSP